MDTPRKLWNHIFPEDEHGHLIVFTGSRPEDGGNLQDKHQRSYGWPEEAGQAEEYLLLQSEAGRETYFSVHLFREPVRDGVGRTKANARETIWAIWCDGDGATLPAEWRPNIVVETSSGRDHFYLLLSRPVSGERAEELAKRLTYAIGGDKGKWCLTTVLRPPGTSNYKRKEPHLVTACLLSKERHDPDDLDRMLPPLEEVAPILLVPEQNIDRVSLPSVDEPPIPLLPADLAAWRGERATLKGDRIDRSRTLHWIGCGVARGLRLSGLSEVKQLHIIAAAVEERDATLGYAKYTDRPDRASRYAEIATDAFSLAAQRAATRHGYSEDKPYGRRPNGSGDDTVERAATDTPRPLNCTDLGNARRFVAQNGEDLRYCFERRRWLPYDGQRWAWDNTGQVERRAKDVVNVILEEARHAAEEEERKRLVAWALATESARRIRSLIEMARSEPGVAVSVSDLDRDKMLLNVANGTLDLRSGRLREHRREDLISRYVDVNYDPSAKAPLFKRFLARIQPGQDIQAWIQEYAGYSLTADTSERIFALLYGSRGKNGKSTLVETIRKVVGGNDGYALTAAPEILLMKTSSGVPNDVARLAGARMVSVAETDKGRRLAEALVKQMTGGEDTISARFMRGEWFDFKPTHKIWFSTNHRPVIKGTDEAIWDRVRLVPFEERIPPEEQDKQLAKKLEAELSGILTWAVEGCQRWLLQGMSEPHAIMAVTQEYRMEMDVLGDFVAECCVINSKIEVGAGALYDAYKGWCLRTGEEPVTQKSFGGELKDRGFDNSRRFTAGPMKGKRKWSGIGLLSANDRGVVSQSGNPSPPDFDAKRT